MTHGKHADGNGTIDHPRAYDVFSSIGFLGRRREIFTRLAALSGVRPGDRVLDVGCGTGYLTRIMANVAGPGGRVTGVDPSPAMIEHAGKQAPANCSYLVNEGQSLDLADASCDVVVSTLAVHHIPEADRGRAIREMRRVLRPGGRLLIAEFRPPSNPWVSRLLDRLSAHDTTHNPREWLAGLIADAGLQIRDDGRLSPLLYYVRAVSP